MSIKREELFQALEGVDEKRLEHSERGVSRAVGSRWAKWGAAAAGICLLAAAAIVYPKLSSAKQGSSLSAKDARESRTDVQISSNQGDNSKDPQSETTNDGAGATETSEQPDGQAFGQDASEEPEQHDGQAFDQIASAEQDIGGVDDSASKQRAYGFLLDGAFYYPISYDERERYGLLDNPSGMGDADVEGSSADGGSSADVEGGSAHDESSADVAGSSADNESSAEWKQPAESDLGEPMGVVQGCGDESLNGCKIYHYASFPDLMSICIVAKEKEYEFYCAGGLSIPDEVGQSSDVFLSAYGMPDNVTEIEVQDQDLTKLRTITDAETIQSICAVMAGKKNIGLEENERRYEALWKDTYGNDDVYYDGESMAYKTTDDVELAEKLWHKGERDIRFTTEKGYQFYAVYEPQIKTFECYGFYPVSDQEVEELNRLLEL